MGCACHSTAGASIEAAVAPKLAQQAKPTKPVVSVDLAGAFDGEFGGGISPAGRPRLAARLMASLLYLKHAFNLSDEELVARWAENVQWQFFSGMGLVQVFTAQPRHLVLPGASPSPASMEWVSLSGASGG